MDTAAALVPPLVAGPLCLAPFAAIRLAASRVGDAGLARTFARPYRGVPERLAAWQRRGLAVRDETPALYLHQFTVGAVTVRGLVGALDVSCRARDHAQRAILPHEAVYPAQVDDLADRMAQMALNPAPILLVQHSPAELRSVLAGVRARVPQQQFVDHAGQPHRLWAIRDVGVLEAIAAALAPTSCLIADGHHRYAAYLRLNQRDPSPITAAGLAMLVDHDDTPLQLGAIHRVVRGTTFDDVVHTAARIGWRVADCDLASARAIVAAPERRDEIVVTDRDRWAVVHPSTGPESVEAAAVELVHDRLLPALSYGPTRLGYHHDLDDALAHASPQAGPALLLPAPTLDRVLAVAAENRLLPEKATSFQPKPPLGVLLRPLSSVEVRRP